MSDSASVSLRHTLPPVYAAAALRLAFPLLVLPLMASRLGADEFGRLGLSLVWAGLLSIVVEGGFLGAATRRAVVADTAGRRLLARQVFSARCVLSSVAALLALVAGARTAAPTGMAWGWAGVLLLPLLACALGWPATWYLQATSQLHRWARVELAVLLVLLVATVALAHSVEAYLLLQFIAAAVLAWLGWRWLHHDLGTASTSGLWRTADVRPGLAMGASMLPVTVAGAAYSLALPAIAAAGMARSELGVYFLADRIVRALLSAADPLVQLVYPRIVERFRLGARVALRYAGRWAAGGLLAGAALLAAGLLAWPLVQRGLGGVDVARLHAAFSVLGWLLPLLMGWKFIGYWMLGSGRYDHAYRACVITGGVCGAAGAWWLGRDAVTLAGVSLAAEGLVISTAVMGIALTERCRRARRA